MRSRWPCTRARNHSQQDSAESPTSVSPRSGPQSAGTVVGATRTDKINAHTQARTVVMASHVLHEVQSLTPRIVLIHRGRLLAQGPVEEVRQLLSRHPRKVYLKARDPRALARALLGLTHVHSATLDEETGGVHVETRDIRAFHSELPALASRTRSGIESLESSDASLDAVFDYLVG